MAHIVGDAVLDGGLNVIHEAATGIYICSSDPTTYTEAVSTFAIGAKSFPPGTAFGPPGPASGGRQVASTPIRDGNMTPSGRPAAWAGVDDAGRRLLANGRLNVTEYIAAGNTFTLPSFTVGIPSGA